MTGGEFHYCARCGVRRRARGVTAVCKDCKDVMSKEEWLLWCTPQPSVELSHEKEAA